MAKRRLKRLLDGIFPRRFRPRVRRPRVAVLRIEGVISPASREGNVNLRRYYPVIEKFFRSAKFQQHLVLVNSPGGSPAQSQAIAAELREQAKQFKRKLTVYVEDVAASGGYWIALAGDEIVAMPSSIVGSIGVISTGFGFDRLIDRWDIDRRTYVAGENKLRLDPFAPEKPDDVAFLKSLQQQLHQQFIEWVKLRRKNKLTAEDTVLFNGDFWLGTRAAELGLVDRQGNLLSDVRKKYGKNVKIHWFTPKGQFFSFFHRFFSLHLASALESALTELRQWGPYRSFH